VVTYNDLTILDRILIFKQFIAYQGLLMQLVKFSILSLKIEQIIPSEMIQKQLIWH